MWQHLEPRLAQLVAAVRGAAAGLAFTNPTGLGARSRLLQPSLDSSPQYAVQLGSGGIRHLSARGEQPRVSQVLLDGIRALPGPVGIVLVELGETSREWLGTGLPRVQVLEAVIALRDLLGRGRLDVAVFSSGEGVEIFLDRFGGLEIRTGGWWEPRARSLLENRGFRWKAALPEAIPSPPFGEISTGERERIAAVCDFLELRATVSHIRAKG